jgi:hypothetical protein
MPAESLEVVLAKLVSAEAWVGYSLVVVVVDMVVFDDSWELGLVQLLIL